MVTPHCGSVVCLIGRHTHSYYLYLYIKNTILFSTIHAHLYLYIFLYFVLILFVSDLTDSICGKAKDQFLSRTVVPYFLASLSFFTSLSLSLFTPTLRPLSLPSDHSYSTQLLPSDLRNSISNSTTSTPIFGQHYTDNKPLPRHRDNA